MLDRTIAGRFHQGLKESLQVMPIFLAACFRNNPRQGQRNVMDLVNVVEKYSIPFDLFLYSLRKLQVNETELAY